MLKTEMLIKMKFIKVLYKKNRIEKPQEKYRDHITSRYLRRIIFRDKGGRFKNKC